MLWSDVPGSAVSLVISNHLMGREGLILTNQDSTAEMLAREIAYFHPELSEQIIYIPDSETLPFDIERPSASILTSRALGIARLISKNVANPIVVSSVRNAMRLFAGEAFWSQRIELRLGGKLPEGFDEQLSQWGYQAAYRTKGPGQFSFRGLVFDIFPAGGILENQGCVHAAARIKMNQSGEITQIKKLDPLTQDSSGSHQGIMILPMRDYPFDKAIIEGFRKNAYELHSDPRSTTTYKTISKGNDHPELSWWMAFGTDGAVSLLDLLKAPTVYLDSGVEASISEFHNLVQARHEDVLKDATRVIPMAERCFMGAQALLDRLNSLKTFQVVEEHQPGAHSFGYTLSGMKRRVTLNESLRAIEELIAQGGTTLFVIKSHVRQKHMSVMLNMMGYKARRVSSFNEFWVHASTPPDQPQAFICQGDIVNGHAYPAMNYRVITEREIFGSMIETKLDDEITEHQRKIILQGLHEIKIGEPIVHAMYGVGRFAGFETINMEMKVGMDEDVVKISYADEAMAFVRIRDLDLVSRYSGGAPEKAPLSRLNDPAWLAKVKTAQLSANQVASDLVKLRSMRERSVGITLKPADSRYDRFCEVFIYEETLDQINAIKDIIRDLTSGKPMDRLVCGDVGFGKTEVAMRAAFLVASQGYQVAILAPTTILAEQHYHSFVSRFEETNITIALANRNTLGKADLDRIKSGKNSIVIGTHRLLQNDVEFKNLGLIIVDEEHRFGVRQKEVLRQIRGNKHMLTLTATPIPRTLGLAIGGIRDLSVLATPPARRQAVRTIVNEMSDSAIVVALTRELARNGQVFYLHNIIDTMDECVGNLQRLVPQARIGKIHGKMSELEMARTMLSFRNHEFDILVSTTVIEIGIDVPNANTLIIEGADNLGLAQLHQLRGRVGRSARQAYAYLLHSRNTTSATGMARLRAMEKASNLGEGVLIARHDMEIRGVGEILGEDQSGHVHEIGFALYMRLLEQSVRSIENPKGQFSIMLAGVDMPMLGSIPESFIPETGERLAWYQRLMSSESRSDLKENLSELEDLYGYLPDETRRLQQSIEKHMLLRRWGIKKAERVGGSLEINFHEDVSSQTILVLSLMFMGKTSHDRKTMNIKGISMEDLFLAMEKNTNS